MLFLTLSKKLNQAVGSSLLRYALTARYALGGGVVRDNPGLDAFLLLPWAMKIISLEVHDETRRIEQEGGTSGGKGGSGAAAEDTQSARLAVLERYLRPALLPNEKWSDVAGWMFHIRLVKWARSEVLWALHGDHVKTALLAYPKLRRSPQLLTAREIKQQPLPSSTKSLPPASLVRDAFDLHDWTDKKSWSATGREMSRLAKSFGGRVVECGSAVRFTDLDPDADLSGQSLPDVFEMAGAYVAQCGPLNALCEKRNVYQVWTREYVEQLGRYLLGRTEAFDGHTIVLDVGAGDGLLAHFLRESFEEIGKADSKSRRSQSGRRTGGTQGIETRPGSGKIPTVIATDDGSWRISNVATVEPLSVEETIERYVTGAGNVVSDGNCQVIVLCSWMPMNEDWTSIFRKARVDEYVLIGECDDGQCGDNWETWGNHRYLENSIEQEIAAAFPQDDESAEAEVEKRDVSGQEDSATTIPERPYELDGYKRRELDALAPYQFSRFDCRVSKAGRTVCFRRYQ